MTEQQFAYWLQGFAELNPDPPTADQWKSIREHLAMVFKKVTPPVASPINLGGDKRLADLLEESRKKQFIQPQNPWPYQPYRLDQGIRPGEIIC
jgi:hypothetical protein